LAGVLVLTVFSFFSGLAVGASTLRFEAVDVEVACFFGLAETVIFSLFATVEDAASFRFAAPRRRGSLSRATSGETCLPSSSS
jgi:hypothetical protein